MSYFDEVRYEINDEIIQFIFLKKNIKDAVQFCKAFNITMLPTSLQMLQNNPNIIHRDNSDGFALKIFFSFDAISSGLFGINLSAEEVNNLRTINEKSKIIQIYVEGKTKFLGRNERIFVKEYSPCLIDWEGVVGGLILNRMSMENPDEGFIDDSIKQLKAHGDKYPNVFEINTEIGRLYKMKDDLESSIDFYKREILLTQDKNGCPTILSSRAINNLATVYKNRKNLAKALMLYKLAIFLDMNYVEAYLSVLGLLDDSALFIKSIARASMLGSYDQEVMYIIDEYCSENKVNQKFFIKAIQDQQRITDINEPFPEFKIEDPKAYLHDAII